MINELLIIQITPYLYGKTVFIAFWIEDGAGVVNLQTLASTGSNINKITGGEGIFEGATGTLTNSEVFQVANLLVDPTSASKGIVKINGAIIVPTTQKVPEPNATAALVGVGISAIFLLRRRRHSLRSNSKCKIQNSKWQECIQNT